MSPLSGGRRRDDHPVTANSLPLPLPAANCQLPAD